MQMTSSYSSYPQLASREQAKIREINPRGARLGGGGGTGRPLDIVPDWAAAGSGLGWGGRRAVPWVGEGEEERDEG